MKDLKKEEPLLVLFDLEEEYAIHMSDYLREQKGVPWKIKAYTDLENLVAEEKSSHISMFLIAETSFSDELKTFNYDRMIILNESGFVMDEKIDNIDKYQAADKVFHILIDLYLEIATVAPTIFNGVMNTRFVGVYSPIKRCLQTTFALTFSELLAKNKRTLYLSFENFSGNPEIMPGENETDLSDLVYFLNADSEKFKLHFQSIVKERGELAYVPPMKAGQNILTVTTNEWKNLFSRINESGLFDVVVMDLTDNIQGLFEVLRVCSNVYTITRDDPTARVKMMQYENMLGMYDFKDVMEKTIKLSIPRFSYIPESLDQYTRGDLADFVRGKIDELGVL